MSEEFSNAELGGRTLRYVCQGHGAPTVIVDQGQGLSIERGFDRPVAVGWAKVFAEIRKSTRIFMHDRAGLGSSDKAPAPRTCFEMVDDLRGILLQANIAPPYVLVGHSIGGFNVRVFADRYPREVVGLILVDSCHPDQKSRIADILPAKSSGEAPSLQLLRQGLDPALISEGIDFLQCAEQARSVATLGLKPLVVVSQSPRALAPPGMPIEVWKKMQWVWSDLQADLLGLSANSNQVVANHAGHHVQLEEPQLVVDAILGVVREARTGSTCAH